MTRLFKWFAGFFEDQSGGASSKRAIGYFCIVYIGMMVNGSLEGKPINTELLFVLAGIVLFCVGAVTSEFFTAYSKKNNAADPDKK